MPFNKMSITDAKKLLIHVVFFDPALSRSNIEEVINKVERLYPESNSYDLEYWLGLALRNFTAWFIRGEERKVYLEKAIRHLERAYALSEGTIPNEYPQDKRNILDYIDRNTIACEIGYLLIEERVVRDIEKGITYLKPVFETTKDYYPAFCALAEAFYKLGDYLKATEIAFESHRRATESLEFKDHIPTSPLSIAGKSLRAEAKECKKSGDINCAISLLQKSVNMKIASDNDVKMLNKLKELKEQI
jgi:tetratricopeptide (TPR) repeat protein